MPATYVFSPAQRQAILRAYMAGTSAKAIAENYGLSQRPVLRVLREEGVPIRQRPSRRLVDRNRKIIELAEKGYSFDQIARHLGVSRQRAHYIVQRGY